MYFCNLDRVAKAGEVDYSKDFFGTKTNLTVSGQLEGELGATALGAIYTFGPTFRAENSNTPRHLAEFWMVEPEVAFLDQEGLMDLEEDFIKYCVNWALDNCRDDLEFLNKMIDKQLIATLESVVKEDFVRLTYTEGINILEEAVKNGRKFEFPITGWGMDLSSEHERYLVEEHFKRPVIMTDYPSDSPVGRPFVAGVPDRTARLPQPLGRGDAAGGLSGGKHRRRRLSAPRSGIGGRRHRLYAGRRGLARTAGSDPESHSRPRTRGYRCAQPARMSAAATRNCL